MVFYRPGSRLEVVDGESPACGIAASASGRGLALSERSDLDPSEKIALGLVVECGRVTTKELADEAGIVPRAASAVLKRLADKGILAWRGRNPNDLRQYYEETSEHPGFSAVDFEKSIA